LFAFLRRRKIWVETRPGKSPKSPVRDDRAVDVVSRIAGWNRGKQNQGEYQFEIIIVAG
jgi:hypothetical protein